MPSIIKVKDSLVDDWMGTIIAKAESHSESDFKHVNHHSVLMHTLRALKQQYWFFVEVTDCDCNSSEMSHLF